MLDTGEVDDKLIGVIDKEPVYSSYMELADIPKEITAKIKVFFETYKILDNKKVNVTKFDNRLAAYATIDDARKRYLENI